VFDCIFFIFIVDVFKWFRFQAFIFDNIRTTPPITKARAMNPQTLFGVRKAGDYFPCRTFCVEMMQVHLPVQRVCWYTMSYLGTRQSVRPAYPGERISSTKCMGESGCKSRSGKRGEEVNFCSTLASDRTGPSTAVTSQWSSLCANFVVNLVLYCFALNSISARSFLVCS
jgi:hypothetical protein